MARQFSLQKMPNLPPVKLESLRGWDTLKLADQTVARKELQALMEAIYQAGKNRLAIGEHCKKLRDVLGRRIWGQFLNNDAVKVFGIHRATVYKYIDLYDAARTILPQPIMQIALTRPGFSLDADLISAHPPPKTNDYGEMSKYVDFLSRGIRKEMKSGHLARDTEVMKKECYNFIRVRFERLPNSYKTQEAWIKSLGGMMLTLLGTEKTLPMAPVEIPQKFLPKPVGRPIGSKKKKDPEEE